MNHKEINPSQSFNSLFDEYDDDSYAIENGNSENNDIKEEKHNNVSTPVTGESSSKSSYLSWADSLDGSTIISVPYQKHLIDIELEEIQHTEGKKSVLRQIRGKFFKDWKICPFYDQYETCRKGEKCEDIHISHEYLKNKILIKEKEYHEKSIKNKMLSNKILEFISVVVFSDCVRNIPIEAIEITQGFENVKKMFEVEKNQKNVFDHCYFHYIDKCKYGFKCHKIHIQKWLIDCIKNEKM